MKQIINVFILFLINFTVFANVKFFSNDYADIVIDFQKDNAVFFVFGGSVDGSAADFAINAMITKDKSNNEMTGFIQNLEISEIFDYDIERLDREICVELYKGSLKITKLECEGLCPLFSNFLGTYKEKNNMPSYLRNLFLENSLEKTNILYSIKEQITSSVIEFKTIKIAKQYLYNDANENSLTKMYLIQGDKVEVIKQSNDGAWMYILFRGKKEIKKWIPTSSFN